MRPRDVVLERRLSAMAATAAGYSRSLHGQARIGDTGGLDDYADQRAHPGGVRLDLDADREAAEELADARNYLLWGVEPLYAAYLTGDPDAAHAFARRMRALGHIIAAWHALHDA